MLRGEEGPRKTRDARSDFRHVATMTGGTARDGAGRSGLRTTFSTRAGAAMSIYRLLVSLHGFIGVVALASFWAAVFLRKGSSTHRRVGQVFLLSMVGILATAAPMAWVIHRSGRPLVAAFLAYLTVIVAAGVWSQWRAVRDRDSVARYTGPVYLALALLSVASGLLVLVLGLRTGSALLIGFSAIGLLTGSQRLYRRLRRPRLAAQRQWWLTEHYTAAIGNGGAVHVAFFAIGLPQLLPALSGSGWTYVGWFAPVLAGLAAVQWLNRRRRAFG
jgi:hypothetical protein